MGEPYLSIVIASRNDEHGGNTLRRMQVTLNSLIGQLEKFHIEAELVLVDWNPPIDKPPLRDAIVWPRKLEYCTVRIITVPLAIHLKYGFSEEQPMKVIVAYNVGFRRARGQFILQGTIDTLYSDGLMSYIGLRGLKEDVRYRVTRFEVNRNVVQYNTTKERLDYCENNIIGINAQESAIVQLVLYRGLPKLFTNACGDFQLMSKYYWHLLRAYAESDSISAHVDSLLSYASYVAGVREVVLESPMRLYHIDHGDKFNDRTKRTAPLDEWLTLIPFTSLRRQLTRLHYGLAELIGWEVRSSMYGIPVLDSTKCRRICRDMITGRLSYIFNDEDWGLGNEALEECIVNEH